METFLNDIRFGIRMLRKNLSFTFLSVVCMGLGIGANSMIFSVVNATLLKPLPYKEPDRIVVLRSKTAPKNETSVSYPDFLDWKDQSNTLEHMAVLQANSFNLTGMEEPERITGLLVSSDLFSVLGIEPFIGRSFSPEEDRPGGPRVAVISHGLWQRRFGADPNIIGRTVFLNDESCTLIGVMPRSFDFPIKGELLAPIGLDADKLKNRGRQPGLTVLGRLKSGIDQEQARVEMESIASRLEQQYPETNTGRGVLLYILSDRTFGDIRPILLLLQGAVGLVLLIACAAVANLLLTRVTIRQREVAIRAALGASPMRLIRQFLVESSLLSILGGILGILLLLLSIDLIIAILPEDILNVKTISVDGRVLAFTLAISLFTGLLSGVVPAIQSTKHDLNLALKEGGVKTTGGIRRHRIRNALVVGEIAVALTLLICAGLSLKGFLLLLRVNPGVSPQNVITMHVPLSQSKYPEGHQQTAFFNNAVERIEALPGVQSAAVGTPLPFTGEGFKMGFSIDGRPKSPDEEIFRAETAMISSSYFRVMGIPLIKGRQFADQDIKESPGVVIIDDTMDARFWPNEESIGKRISIRGPEGPWLSVVGVVGHVKNFGLDAASQVQIYLPYPQRPYYWANIVVRTAPDPNSMAATLRDAVWSVDRDQPVANIRTMDQLLSNLLAPKRVAMILLGIFAGLALILSVLGIYGVSSFLIAERTREIGIRVALGARPTHVIRLVMTQIGSLALVGILIGLIGAFTLTRLIASRLYGVSDTDTVIFAACSALLGAVALLASYLPARRAMRVDPMTALRFE